MATKRITKIEQIKRSNPLATMRRWVPASLLRWIALALLLSLNGWTLWNNQKDLEVIWKFSWYLFPIAIGFHALQLWICAYQLHSILQYFQPKLQFRTWAEIFFTARFLNRLTPMSADAHRLTSLKVLLGVSVVAYLTAMLFLSIITRLTTLWCTTILIAYVDPPIEVAEVRVGGILLSVAVICSVILMLIEKLIPNDYSGLTATRSRSAATIFFSLLREKRLVFKLICGAVATFILGLSFEKLCFYTIDHDIPSEALGVLRLGRSLAGFVELTPGNLGVSESVYGSLSHAMELSVAPSILVALYGTVTSLISLTAIGGAMLLWKRKGKSLDSES